MRSGLAFLPVPFWGDLFLISTLLIQNHLLNRIGWCPTNHLSPPACTFCEDAGCVCVWMRAPESREKGDKAAYPKLSQCLGVTRSGRSSGKNTGLMNTNPLSSRVNQLISFLALKHPPLNWCSVCHRLPWARSPRKTTDNFEKSIKLSRKQAVCELTL